MLSGTVEVVLGDHAETLTAGDAMTFPGNSPHTWRNPGPRPCKVIWSVRSGTVGEHRDSHDSDLGGEGGARTHDLRIMSPPALTGGSPPRAGNSLVTCLSPPLEPVDESWETALVVVAHPDDVGDHTLGVIARWTDQGKTVVYCLVTSGEAGIDGMTPDEAREVRIGEQIASAHVVGVETVEFLGLPNSIVEYRTAVAPRDHRGHPQAPARHRHHEQLP